MKKVIKVGSLLAIAMLLSAAPAVMAQNQNANPKAKSECCQQKKDCKRDESSKKCDCKKECTTNKNGKSECAKNDCAGKCATKQTAKK